MSSSETLYTPRVRYPQVLERGRQQVVRLEVYRDGALAAPSAGTYSLVSPSGEVEVGPSSVTISSSVATYTIPAASLPTTLATGEDWSERWSLTMPDGTTRMFDRPAAIARRALYPVVVDADIDPALYPGELSRLPASASGTFQGWLDEAWALLLRWLCNRGVLASTVASPDAMREAHRHQALVLYFTAQSRQNPNQNTWASLAKEHKEGLVAALGELQLLLDRDEDGTADSLERRAANQPIYRDAYRQRDLSRGRW